jgi:5-methylcytosine-specific restriction endonuclease McrA
MSLGGEYRLWYLKDLIGLLVSAGARSNDSLIKKASATVDHIDALYDKNETKYFEAVDRDTAYDQADALIQHYESKIRSVFGFYADNYAERVFHDRQLCEHVNHTLVAVGFDGRNDWTGPAKQWVGRQDNWPAWAVKAVQARDRGRCAQCDADLYLGLVDKQHIDHIVPLAAGVRTTSRTFSFSLSPATSRRDNNS